MKKSLLIITVVIFAIIGYKLFLSNVFFQSKNAIEEIIEPVYTQDCFPRTLQQSGVTKKCFENANLGQDMFCTKEELRKIKDYYKKGQNKDPLNNSLGQFCAE